jgi:hypothetical protein
MAVEKEELQLGLKEDDVDISTQGCRTHSQEGES